MRMTQEEYHIHNDEMNGYCPVCDCIVETGDFEPDARERECEECGKSKAMGLEEALIENKIRFT